jgi:DNA-binding Lrp family transcriptional regulator
MCESQGVFAGSAQSSPLTWEAARLAVGLLIEVSRISRGDADLLQPLVLTAILDANQADLNKDLRLQRLYGAGGAALPDELRRPISINAVAQSLRLPFETVRRRAQRLAQAGLCVFTPAGVYVPHSAVTSPAYMAMQAARVDRLARFKADLIRVGVLPGEAPGSAAAWPGVRAADRALAQYVLRASDTVIALTGHVVTGAVLLGLCAVNTDHLADAELAALPLSFDALAVPCAMTRVAEHLQMPSETVRRQLIALAAAGYARRVGANWVAAAPPEMHPVLGRAIEENLVNIRRLFARLRDLAEADPPAVAPERLADRPSCGER